MRVNVVVAGVSVVASLAVAVAAPANADPVSCDGPTCTPGITPGVVLGAPCADTAYFVFGTAVAGPSTLPGRLVFCGSPRRYEPRYFRSPSMAGIKELDADCAGYERWVAQAPDGLFLICQSQDGAPRWRRGDA
ncbi:hypothetical protein [Mycobacterium sp. ACS4331]|uniref:hypothetical protein n=1 Tax=Mycobacterium sp. ACS4331 TaxID=1834121 RepID=UPI0007FBE3E2|nr:hypothetical protein [Mycobacterium sp. ACS4331]OBF13664.1 hypothetical protein A5727_16495 [Mycobacterium sp. ACS4331]